MAYGRCLVQGGIEITRRGSLRGRRLLGMDRGGEVVGLVAVAHCGAVL